MLGNVFQHLLFFKITPPPPCLNLDLRPCLSPMSSCLPSVHVVFMVDLKFMVLSPRKSMVHCTTVPVLTESVAAYKVVFSISGTSVVARRHICRDEASAKMPPPPIRTKERPPHGEKCPNYEKKVAKWPTYITKKIGRDFLGRTLATSPLRESHDCWA